MRPPQPLLTPVLKKRNAWAIEWYHLHDGNRIRVRKSRFNDVDLNAISDLEEREKVAQQMLVELRARLRPPVERPEHTPVEVALRFAVELKRSAKAASNKSFTETARWFLEFLHSRGWGLLRCDQLEGSHIQAYFDSIIIKNKVANSTHNTRKNNLRSLFSELVTRKYISANFVSKVPDRVVSDPIRRPLDEQEKAILAAYIFKHDRALSLAFVLLGYLAIRPGEIRNLRVGAIDLRAGVVRFPARESKNNRDSTITIPADVLPMLRSWKLEQYPPSYYLFGKAKGRHNVTLAPQPERIGTNTLSNRFRVAVRTLHREGKLHNIKGVQFYSLKDTLAIYLLDNGVDVESAMRHFRHRDLAVFQRYVKRLGVVNEKIRQLPIDLKLPE